MPSQQSELTVIVKAKDLASYVLTVTEESLKRFRFTLVAKLQGYALNIIENLYRANEVYVAKGDTDAATRRLEGFLREHYRAHGDAGWSLKIDVRKYFDSIDHSVLKKRLERFPDDETRAFLYEIVDSYNADTGKGLPLGNQSSQWFALYYLDPIDRMVKERFRVRHYTRYMDDMVLVHPDRGYLAACLDELCSFARDELMLEFNQKTQLSPLAQGIDYLGWHFNLSETGKVVRRLRPSNKRRLKRRMRKLRAEVAEGEVTQEQARRIVAGIDGHLRQGDTGALRWRVLG